MDNVNSGAESAQAPAPAVARILAVRPRSQTIELEWPVEYDGKTYTQVTVSRMTTEQVSEFVSAAKVLGSKTTLPMFDVPGEVIDALDPDDADKVGEAVQSFLPRALKMANELMFGASTTTSPSPPQPSAPLSPTS